MSQKASSSKTVKSIQNIAFQKISAFITRFHAVLLNKANNSGVYRDLSQQQQYLLTNLQNDNYLHSILAGCLAVDSCLSNICQIQQNLTDNILKALTILCSTWQKIQSQLIQCVETKSLSITKVEQFWKQIELSIRNLLNFCHDLPSSFNNQQIKKQQKIMSQQDITFKISSMKLFQQPFQNELQISNDLDSRLKLKQMHKQNIILQQKINLMEKKIVELQIKNAKFMQNSKNSQQDKSRQKNHQRKYSQPIKQQKQTQNTNKILSHLYPSSQNTNQQKQYQILFQQNSMLKTQIKKIRQEYAKEKRKLLRQIKFLQHQLKNAQQNQDRELIQLLQELEEEIQSLRQERRQDQKIVGQILHKLQNMNATRQSRTNKISRLKQSVVGSKALQLLRDKLYYDQINIQEQRRSPSFRKQKGRNRFYTKNDEVYKSSLSFPKKTQYIQLQNPKYRWKAQRLKHPQPKQQFYNSKNYHQMDKKYYKYQQKPQYNYWSPENRIQKNEKFTPRVNEQNIKNIKRNLYSGPLVQSKIGKQSFIKGQDKFPSQYGVQASIYKSKNLQQQQNYQQQINQQSQYDNLAQVERIDKRQRGFVKQNQGYQKPYQNTLNKVNRWQQIAARGSGQKLGERLKTSRI